jgi:hypothetical protein
LINEVLHAFKQGVHKMTHGDSAHLFASAIPIYALDSVRGIAEQNDHLSRLFGRRGMDWEKALSGLSCVNGFWFDRVHVYFEGRSYVVCFDVTPLMVLQATMFSTDTDTSELSSV